MTVPFKYTMLTYLSPRVKPCCFYDVLRKATTNCRVKSLRIVSIKTPVFQKHVYSKVTSMKRRGPRTTMNLEDFKFINPCVFLDSI